MACAQPATWMLNPAKSSCNLLRAFNIMGLKITMGIKIMKKIFGVLFFIVTLCGCVYSGSEKYIPTQTEQLCHELKRNIIFNTTSGPTFGAASATQKAEMYRLYDKYNCGKLEKK